jgi:hypothetical protein
VIGSIIAMLRMNVSGHIHVVAVHAGTDFPGHICGRHRRPLSPAGGIQPPVNRIGEPNAGREPAMPSA